MERLEPIDAPHDIVVFSLVSGELIVPRRATAEGRSFVTGLRAGDVVHPVYAEALAPSVEEL